MCSQQQPPPNTLTVLLVHFCQAWKCRTSGFAGSEQGARKGRNDLLLAQDENQIIVTCIDGRLEGTGGGRANGTPNQPPLLGTSQSAAEATLIAGERGRLCGWAGSGNGST